MIITLTPIISFVSFMHCTGKIQLWGHDIAVDWADPEPEVDEETMSKVIYFTVYLRIVSNISFQVQV